MVQGRHKQPRVIAPVGRPKAPKHFSIAEKAIWKQVCKELETLGNLATTDATAVELYCTSLASFREACKSLAEHGSVIQHKTGYQSQSPWITIRNNAHKNVLKLLEQFGMTPKSRKEMRADGVPVTPQTTKMKDLMQRNPIGGHSN